MRETVTTDLTHFGPPPFRGHVDVIDRHVGVRGWALDLFAPQRPVPLELLLGDRVIAETTPNLPRDDISALVGAPTAPGFVFDAAALARASAGAVTPDDVITVRIAGTDYVLGDAGTTRAAQLFAPGADAAAPGAWQPAQTTSQAHGAKAYVERVLVLPGFGCLIEGWAISPLHRIMSLQARLGGATLTAAPDAILWKPRPDLLATFPDQAVLASRAGFAALFEGPDLGADDAEPTLSLAFVQGGTAVFPISPKTMRLLGHAAGLEEAAPFFPALREERFFPRFAQAALRAQRDALRPPVPIVVAPARRTLVCGLPDSRDDQFLMFEALAQACRQAPLPGLVLLAAASSRADAPWMLQDLLRSHPIPASLLVLDSAHDAFALLPDILRLTGTRRFAFAGAGLLLTPVGVQAAQTWLNSRGGGLALMGVSPGPHDQAPALTARAFAWTSDAFTAWAATAPRFYDGILEENGLTRADPRHKIWPGAVRPLHDLTQPPLLRALNETLRDLAEVA